MKIEYLGHASFRITASDGTTIVTDPYEPGYGGGSLGFGKIQAPADIVTISHEHGDHNYAVGVPGNPTVVRGAGIHKVKGIEFNAVATFHDDQEGSKRGPNSVMCFEVDGVNVCHLGDLGHPLSDLQGAAIGDVDVLLAPVGGSYTIDANVASQTVDALKPKVVLPMHYSNAKCKFPIAPVDNFLAGKPNVKRDESSQIELSKDSLPSNTRIIVLEAAL